MPTHHIRGADGVELVVDEAGAGQPVLLLHGVSQSRMCWRKQFESSLTNRYRLIAPDMRGHGDSEKPRDAYAGTRVWADDVRAIIEAFDLNGVVVVAWSYAGLLALDYLSEYGTDDVVGLNLVSAIASIGTEQANQRLGPEYLDLIPGFVSTDAEESTQAMRTFVELCVERSLPPEELYFQLGYNVMTPPHVRDSLRSRSTAHESVLESIDIPVLLTHGQEDAVILPSASEEYLDLISHAEISRYPDTGHSPFWERPQRFNEELRSCIEEM